MLLAVVWWVATPSSQISVGDSRPTVEQSRTSIPLTSVPVKPAKMFHFKGNPTNAEEQAIWDWWFYMDKVDPDFQWRTPIEFYGKEIDQHGEPVVGARVRLEWSALGSVPKRELTTGSDGNFAIAGIQGKGISVDVGAPGYTN